MSKTLFSWLNLWKWGEESCQSHSSLVPGGFVPVMVPFEGIGCVRFLLLLYVCASPETRGRKCSGGGRKAHCHWNLSVSFSPSASTHKTVSTPQFVTVAPHLPVKCHYCVLELYTHTSGSCTFTLRSRHSQLSFKYQWVFHTGWSFFDILDFACKETELRWWSYGH